MKKRRQENPSHVAFILFWLAALKSKYDVNVHTAVQPDSQHWMIIIIWFGCYYLLDLASALISTVLKVKFY